MRIRQCTFHGHGAPTANSVDLVILLAGPSSLVSTAMGAFARAETDGGVVLTTGCDPQQDKWLTVRDSPQETTPVSKCGIKSSSCFIRAGRGQSSSMFIEKNVHLSSDARDLNQRISRSFAVPSTRTTHKKQNTGYARCETDGGGLKS